ncbi:MAG: IcmT/TraK family protein [Alphaproteobacteria bacterium]|nr:IcmT/TraK family protein [Alphaproteobacteria bacterium]
MSSSSQDETFEERTQWHWRNTMRPVRFFGLDARAVIPFCVLLVYARPVTLFITAVVTFTFYFFERRGLTFPAALRALRSWLIGSRRPGLVSFRRRREIDYG